MPSWPTTAERVITAARRDIGLGESPNGSNRNRISAWYGIGPGAWCAMAVAYWFNKAGCEIRDRLGAREKNGQAGWAYTPVGVAAAKRAGLWHSGSGGIKRGDVVFFKLPGAEGSDFVNHVGIVTSAGTTSIMSLEGNTANVVAERTRPRPYIVGYMRPPYATTSKPKPSPTAPPFPGRAAVQLGSKGPSVTLVDRQLIRLGYTRHHDGNGYQAGPHYTQYTRDNVRAFQKAQGWRGPEADGNVGPETWRRLFTTRAAA